MLGWEGAIYTLSVRRSEDPSSTIPTYREIDNEKKVDGKKESEQLRKIIKHWPCS